jgi:hypothetical protein
MIYSSLLLNAILVAAVLALARRSIEQRRAFWALYQQNQMFWRKSLPVLKNAAAIRRHANKAKEILDSGDNALLPGVARTEERQPNFLFFNPLTNDFSSGSSRLIRRSRFFRTTRFSRLTPRRAALFTGFESGQGIGTR